MFLKSVANCVSPLPMISLSLINDRRLDTDNNHVIRYTSSTSNLCANGAFSTVFQSNRCKDHDELAAKLVQSRGAVTDSNAGLVGFLSGAQLHCESADWNTVFVWLRLKTLSSWTTMRKNQRSSPGVLCIRRLSFPWHKVSCFTCFLHVSGTSFGRMRFEDLIASPSLQTNVERIRRNWTKLRTRYDTMKSLFGSIVFTDTNVPQ